MTALNWTPHDYQLRAIESLVSKPGFALFADPGLGKTSTALGAFTVLKDNNAARGLLVVAPLRPTFKVWPAEINRWADFSHLRVKVLHGSKKAAALREEADVYCINYEGLAWLEKELSKLAVWPFDVLVLDESHKVKNASTQRFKILKGLRERFARCWLLTGTPASNGAADLFGQLYFVDKGERLGRYVTHFRRTFCDEHKEWGGYSTWTLKPGAQRQIEQRISDVSLSLSGADYLKLPRLIENIIPVTLSERARSVYEDLEDEFLAQLDSGVVTAANAGAKSIKLRQVVGGGVYGSEGAAELDSSKVDALLDLIEEQAGQPLLVAVAFTHEVDRIRKALGRDVPYLGDGISVAAANRIVDDWNAGKIDVLLAHPASVATGLNLQSGGNSVVWFGLTWSQADHQQFIARVWRQGQTKPCIVHYLIAEDTVDERVLEALRAKEAAQSALLAALKQKNSSSSNK